ncbi:hypothetical protein BDA99DRAFT_77516 [Phascolomyces articulosus]|uniref:BRISC and BRCA1-A complex member 2 n=1 Tax=Phascolomyces articulosus TaxID=60185 RepID=A0AAD5PDL3_9FUNG|nr:hypothetical protein BDA99DRAFT_77516 [Phascolomyces articulosus]
MDENRYSMLQVALKYLDENRISGVHIFSGQTSDPYYGQGKSRHYDRLDISFSYQGDRAEVPCQIVFDSSDYEFPPDLIIDPAWQNFSSLETLPSEWHIDNPECIHEWLSTLWLHFNQMLFGEEEYDQLQSSRECTPVSTPAELPHPSLSAPAAFIEQQYQDLITSTRETSITSFSDDREQQPSRSHTTQPEIMTIEDQSTSVEEYENTMDIEHRSPIERRAFIEQWISDMPNHVIRFDADQFSSIVLYMTVKIPDAIWSEMSMHHQRLLNDCTTKVGKAKNTAPAVVQLTMDEGFPDTPITILLISAINSDPIIKEEPEQRQFEMGMNTHLSLEEMCERVKDTLIEEIPKFHSGLFDNS